MLPHSEDRKVNELLRRVMLQAGLREDDLAARLGVDPKTVRRWLNGRIPYPHNRAAIADLLGVGEADLWPGAGGTLTARVRPDELGAVYPHRRAMLRGRHSGSPHVLEAVEVERCHFSALSTA